ncbi:class I SAM-dependent methyltransferase [Amycolatopsis panacis]|uniref:class I SAM-dependent methyltransferase n=1 Tax=Amycolatopsis panacis TaxID=2340917 RepID=UPI001F3435B8|nr:class I SAM-dependent methyltransferase [Amycolatopsis panacis]
MLVALEAAGGFSGEVLDIGGGPGDDAAFLTTRGHHATGLDSSPAAVTEARAKGLDISFGQADATRLDGYEGRFDSALHHCLDEETRPAHLAALVRATRPGARLHILCFPDTVPENYPVPDRDRRSPGRRRRPTPPRRRRQQACAGRAGARLQHAHDRRARPGGAAVVAADRAAGVTAQTLRRY